MLWIIGYIVGLVGMVVFITLHPKTRKLKPDETAVAALLIMVCAVFWPIMLPLSLIDAILTARLKEPGKKQ